jgi:hypothetical protein
MESIAENRFWAAQHTRDVEEVGGRWSEIVVFPADQHARWQWSQQIIENEAKKESEMMGAYRSR